MSTPLNSTQITIINYDSTQFRYYHHENLKSGYLIAPLPLKQDWTTLMCTVPQYQITENKDIINFKIIKQNPIQVLSFQSKISQQKHY